MIIWGRTDPDEKIRNSTASFAISMSSRLRLDIDAATTARPTPAGRLALASSMRRTSKNQKTKSMTTTDKLTYSQSRPSRS